MGASTDPCGRPEVTAADEDVSLPGLLPVCCCPERSSPIPASSLMVEFRCQMEVCQTPL